MRVADRPVGEPVRDALARGRGFMARRAVLIAGFAVLLVLTLVVVIVTFLQLRSTIDTYEELERRARVLDASQDLRIALELRTNAQQRFLITGEDRYLDELAAARETFRLGLERVRAGVRTSEGLSLVDDAAREGRALAAVFDRAVIRIRAGGDARELFEQRVDPQTRATTAAVERFTSLQEVRLDVRVRESEDQALLAERVIVGLGIGALAVGGLVAAVVLGAVARRDRRLGVAAEEIERLSAGERHIAAALQASLLPRALPEVVGPLRLAARYRPSGALNTVGGDTYDFFALPGGGHLCLICDVCGKGPEAAAVTALVRHTARVVVDDDPGPAGVLERINEQMLRQRGDTRFVTVAAVRILPEDQGLSPSPAELHPGAGAHRLTVALGGHLPPLAVRADGRVERLGAPGSLLGVLPTPRIRERTAELGVGDALVLYSDGVTEARRGDEEFGEERLRALLGGCGGLAPAEIAARIERAVDEFEEGAPRDDLTLLVVAVAPAGMPAAEVPSMPTAC